MNINILIVTKKCSIFSHLIAVNFFAVVSHVWIQDKLASYRSSDLSKFLQIDFEWATRLNRLGLQLVGLWPKTEEKFRRKLLHHSHVFVVFLLFVLVVLLPYTLSLLRIYEDVTLMIEHLQFISPITSCIVKFVIFWWKKEGIIITVSHINRFGIIRIDSISDITFT